MGREREKTYVAELVSSVTTPLRLVRSVLERARDARVRKAGAAVDPRKTLTDELNVDRPVVAGERGGVLRVEKREVKKVGVAGVDVGDELLTFAELAEAVHRVLAVLGAPVEEGDKRERRVLGLTFEGLELRGERAEAGEGDGLGVSVCEEMGSASVRGYKDGKGNEQSM